MERHRCKLCSKNFSNGRALGGHMRSHLFNLPIFEEMPAEELEQKPVYHTESASSASSSSSSEEDEGEVKDQGYGLRENPKKSVRLADPEFSFAGSIVLQDRGSETESSKNPTWRRSKRIQKSSHASSRPPLDAKKKIKLSNFSSRVEESCYRAEQEQGSSSISDATTEEDVAFCLMMLSRDKWKRQKQTMKEAKFAADKDLEVEEKEGGEGEDEDEDDDEETDESDELENCKVIANNRNYQSRGKYRCETCKKTFRSYQALGGHRASHKKARLLPPLAVQLPAHESVPAPITAKGDSIKVHECPYCSRVFSSGQALGGHKRSHTANYGTSITVPIREKKSRDTLIDLNLPAPIDDDDLVELSAVSDAECLYHTAR